MKTRKEEVEVMREVSGLQLALCDVFTMNVDDYQTIGSVARDIERQTRKLLQAMNELAATVEQEVESKWFGNAGHLIVRDHISPRRRLSAGDDYECIEYLHPCGCVEQESGRFSVACDQHPERRTMQAIRECAECAKAERIKRKECPKCSQLLKQLNSLMSLYPGWSGFLAHDIRQILKQHNEEQS